MVWGCSSKSINMFKRVILFSTEVVLSGHPVTFNVTEHFAQRAVERKFLQEVTPITVGGLVSRAVIIENRPGKVGAIMDHGFKDNICLYDNDTKSISVVEEKNTLVTVYSSTDSRWSQKWLSKTPKDQRILFETWAAKLPQSSVILWK